MKAFADYTPDERHLWITLSAGEYFPDILEDACALYEPVLIMFGQLLGTSSSSTHLFTQIAVVPNPMRDQLKRVFRRYICPELPVEMTKKQRDVEDICARFGAKFRPIQEAQAAYMTRPTRDEALCALLWEQKDRGKKGYNLTGQFFTLFRTLLPELLISGPVGAGKDIAMATVFTEQYPNPNRPVDFAVYDQGSADVLAIGLARYDSDRGGSQEDDRIGGYRNCADEILTYAKAHNLRTKVIFINDGPGLLLGTMWNDYARLEQSWPGQIMVATLRMIPERLTVDWLRS